METINEIKDLLIELGICDDDEIVPYFPRVRDRNDISVMRCAKSGVIFLSRSDHIDIEHYSKQEGLQYWEADDRRSAMLSGLEDAQRRVEQFKLIIANKKWVDIGTGAGGILDLLSPISSETVAVEPQSFARKFLTEMGYNVHASINDLQENYFEVVTLFHVLEHVTSPLAFLTTIKKKMTVGAKIIIEIPHARDFLISFLNLQAFKSFTFWSEHLILHTRESITMLLEKAGFSNIIVKSFQRYPLANHLYWLKNNKPGGHIEWASLRTVKLDLEYANMLSEIDKTDTLIITAKNI